MKWHKLIMKGGLFGPGGSSGGGGSSALTELTVTENGTYDDPVIVKYPVIRDPENPANIVIKAGDTLTFKRHITLPPSVQEQLNSAGIYEGIIYQDYVCSVSAFGSAELDWWYVNYQGPDGFASYCSQSYCNDAGLPEAGWYDENDEKVDPPTITVGDSFFGSYLYENEEKYFFEGTSVPADGWNKVTVNVSGDDSVEKYFEANHAEVNLPNATSLKPYAFMQDRTLVDIYMPKVASIGRNAFASCSNLAITKLPSGLTQIGDYAFNGCTKLALNEFPTGLTTIGDYVFENCTGITATSLPDALTKIGICLFNSCSNLALTHLPSGVTKIGGYAFYGCTNLTITELPSGLTQIGDYAFRNCTNIVITELPSGTDTIGSGAFQSCTALTSITFKSKPRVMSSTAFNNCTNITTINVPWAEGAVSGAPWGATNATINYNYTGE